MKMIIHKIYCETNDQNYPWELLKMNDQDYPHDLLKMNDQDLLKMND